MFGNLGTWNKWLYRGKTDLGKVCSHRKTFGQQIWLTHKLEFQLVLASSQTQDLSWVKLMSSLNLWTNAIFPRYHAFFRIAERWFFSHIKIWILSAPYSIKRSGPLEEHPTVVLDAKFQLNLLRLKEAIKISTYISCSQFWLPLTIRRSKTGSKLEFVQF